MWTTFWPDIAERYLETATVNRRKSGVTTLSQQRVTPMFPGNFTGVPKDLRKFPEDLKKEHRNYLANHHVL